jgi:aspartokinase-like uncharacterized kinase
MGVEVVKVGGSLLDFPEMPRRLQSLFRQRRNVHRVVITGGGQLVDYVRAWHARRPLDDVAAHWMCVDLMTITARLLWSQLPEFAFIDDDRRLLQRLGEPGTTVFAPARWLRESEPHLPGEPLNAGWEVTSDAIAGRLALVLRADRLVLLKSAAPPGDVRDLEALAVSGYIDPALAAMGRALPPLDFVNLRAA